MTFQNGQHQTPHGIPGLPPFEVKTVPIWLKKYLYVEWYASAIQFQQNKMYPIKPPPNSYDYGTR